MRVRDLGTLPYPDAHGLMRRLVEERRRDEIGDTLLLVQHDHVFTRGRKSRDLSNLVDPGDVPVVEVERGGDVTYHGPGQVVAYPVAKLEGATRDAPRFIRRLEGWIIGCMDDLGVPGGTRRPPLSGVWCQEGSSRGDPSPRVYRKLASVGVAVTADWITWHGIALNVSTDLSYFARINPCGLDATVMSSLSALSGRSIGVDDARTVMALRPIPEAP